MMFYEENMLTKNKMNIKSVIITVSIFMLIFMDSSYWMAISNIFSGRIRIALLLAIAVFTFILNANKRINIKKIIFLNFLIASALLCMAVRKDGSKNYIILLSSVIIGYIFSESINFNEFIKKYNNIIHFVAIYSLVVAAISIIYPTIILKFPIIDTRFGTVTIHNLLFSVSLNNSIYFRNYGLFWEPGAFQIFLNLALIFEMFFINTPRKSKIIVYIITIITTFSTTGYIVLTLILISYFIRSKKIKIKWVLILIILIVLIIALFKNVIPKKYTDLVFDKLSGIFSEDEKDIKYTTLTRLNAIKYPLEEFMKSPILRSGV